MDIGEDGVAAVRVGVPERELAMLELFREECDEGELDEAEIPGENVGIAEEWFMEEEDDVGEER